MPDLSRTETAMYAANRAVREYGGPVGHPEWRKLVDEANRLQRQWRAEKIQETVCPHCGRPYRRIL